MHSLYFLMKGDFIMSKISKELKTYLTPEEYRYVKGISLDDELRGSSDEEYGDAERFIFRVERKVINYLTFNYAFKEEMLEEDNSLYKFKLGICDQIEEELANGSKALICEEAKNNFRLGGLMNWRAW